MERQPSTYANRQEEDLRDFLLMTLCTHYPNTTGETFNKAGKTDILVRHEGKNVFVGECKFWSGIKAFHDSINQILGYLTWRDSKAAIVCFVKNREINPVLQQVLDGVVPHRCFVRAESKRAESRMHFEFRLPSDATGAFISRCFVSSVSWHKGFRTGIVRCHHAKGSSAKDFEIAFHKP